MRTEDLLRAVYSGDVQSLYANLHPAFRCHTPGKSPVAGTVFGVNGMREHMKRFHLLSGGTFRLDHQGSFTADDRWACVPLQLQARRGDQVLDMLAFGIWRLEDGLFAEHWENPTDIAAFDAFWK
jgi:hypothetical protein